MAIQLSKGQGINLSKENSTLKNLKFGLGWDVNQLGGFDFDPDASCFMLESNGMAPNESHFIFYGNLNSPDGAVHHTGDDRTGGSSEDGPDEVIEVDLTKVAPNIQRIVFVVSIYEAFKRNQNFGIMENAFMNVIDGDTDREIARYNLTENDFALMTSGVFGEVVREGDAWHFKAVGEGKNQELDAYVRQFGLSVA